MRVLGSSQREIDDAKAVADTFPQAEMNGDVSLVEEVLLRWQAAENTFGKEVVKEAAVALQVSEQNAVATMANGRTSHWRCTSTCPSPCSGSTLNGPKAAIRKRAVLEALPPRTSMLMACRR